jgi:hypothetical protein
VSLQVSCSETSKNDWSNLMIIEAVTYEFRVNYNLEKGGCENVLWIGWFIPQNGLF